MFPSQPNNGTLDLGEVPISPSCYIYPPIWDNFVTQEEDLMVEGCGNLTTRSTESQKLLSFSSTGQRKEDQEKNDIEIEDNRRKIMRRDIERQRRKEMAKLHDSLLSLLPLEYTRGKRSTSDHIQEAANYIKRMQNNVQRLQTRKGKLKKLPDLGLCNGSCSQVQGNLPNFVAVNPCTEGVEILISTAGYEEHKGPPLSRILRELLDKGFNVVSCVSSTIADKRTLHRIQSEATNLKLEDLYGLQDRLNRMVNLPRS